MEFGRRVIIAVDMQETTPAQLKQLRKLEFLKQAEIHFVHIYQTTNVIYGMGEFCQVYPIEPDRKALEQSIISSLVQLCQHHVDLGAKVVYRCLFDENPKEEFCLYAKEVKADTMIIFTRERHGLFESSFSQYASRHSPCHLLILKP